MEIIEAINNYGVPIAAGLVLASAVGFRVFLPLAALSWGAHLGYLKLNESFAFLSTPAAVWTFTAAVIIELAGDKIPAVDHTLDAIATFIKPIVGMLVMASPLVEMDPLHALVIGIVAGATVAGGIHLLKAKSRILANLATFGAAAPVLSIIEDFATVLLILMALFIPLIGLAVIMGMVALGLRRRSLSSVSSKHPF